MISPLAHLQKFVPPAIRERGERYLSQGRVEIRATLPYVFAYVRGSKHYEVVLSLDDKVLLVACTCEFFDVNIDVCKHIWATMLAVAGRNRSAFSETTDLHPDPSLFENLRVSPHGRAPRAPSRRDAARNDAWHQLFATIELHRSSDESAIHETATELPLEIRYVLRRWTSDMAPHIDVYGVFAKKSGEPGAPRRLRLPLEAIEKLDEPDRELVALLYGEEQELTDAQARLLFPRVAATGRLYLYRDDRTVNGPLQFDGDPWRFQVAVETGDDLYRISGVFARDDERLALGDIQLVGGEWMIHGTTLGRFEAESSAWLHAIRSRGTVNVPMASRDQLAAAIASAPSMQIALPPDLSFTEVTPVPKLLLARAGSEWRVAMVVRYGEKEIDPSTKDVVKSGGRFIRRRPDLERRFRSELTAAGVDSWGYSELFLSDRKLAPAVKQLSLLGWEIDFSGERLFSGGELTFELESGIDWFDLTGDISFGERRVAFPRLLDSIRRKETFVPVEGGGIALLEPEWISRLEELVAAGQQRDDGVRFGKSQVTLLDALLGSQSDVSFDERFRELKSKIEQWREIVPAEEPSGFGTELRPYQRVGLGWLLFLRDLELGGCLADDMGLGKTVQALALLERVRRERTQRPSLVVAPRSLLFNWRAEAKRFTPEMRVLDHHGVERTKEPERFGDFDLVLTTYATLQRDIAHLAPVEFEYVILDEAQAIKNASARTTKAVKALRARHRLALSGTPIENHLGELWSLFDFLNPGMLGTAAAFTRTFGKKSASPEARERLARIVAPFIMRRTKQMVLSDLPEKDEQTLWVELSERERRDYDELRDHYRASLLDRVEKNGMARSKMHVLEALLRLRQAALHPGLIDPLRDEEGSAKLEALSAELEILADSDHKALVFSQFTSLLDIVERGILRSGVRYVRLDGTTRNRDEVVTKFQNDDSIRVFLLSLKAGGVGLNLTAADYVYLLDPWWNPAVEAQAIDRTHRIGQERKVTATRIVASGTVEEKILELQRHKRALAESIIRADDSLLRSLDVADLEMLLS